MTLDQLTAVMGWATVINIGFLAAMGLSLMALRGTFAPLHARMFGLTEDEVNRAYFQYLANYKILTLVFCLAPYLALRLV